MAKESRTLREPGSDPAKRDARVEAQKEKIQGRFLTKGGNGVATAVTATATDVTVALNLPEPNTNYGVLVTPNWDTTVFVTDKTIDDFVVNFGTAAPADATIDWIVFRA